MTVPGGHEGGWRIGPDEVGQTLGLILFDPENPLVDDKSWPLYAIRLNDEKPACGSPKKRGGYCESTYRFHNGRCNKHGGNAARGAAHGNWKHGQHSRYVKLPERLRERVAFAVEDPELTHHRTSVAVIDELIDEVWQSYDVGANPELWKQVKKLVRRLEVANNAGDYPKAREAFEELKIAVGEGFEHTQQGQQIVRLLEARRRHSDSETKRKLSEAITFSYEGAYIFYTALGTAARKHFGHDQERLTAFLTEVTAIAGEHGVADRGEGRALPPGD